MPVFDTNELLGCIKKLVTLDESWYPNVTFPTQLYIRLCHISTDAQLGVKTPKNTKIFAILNPANLKAKTLKLKCAPDVIKNWPLGHGEFRVSGNLGPLLPTVADAKRNGFDDVLWMLDDYLKELTVLNIFILWKSRFGSIELLTPPNDGTIFNGVTRMSITELKDKIKKEKGINLIERPVSIHEVISAYNEERLIEAFGTATSSLIKPISRIVYKDANIDMTSNYDFANYLNDYLISIRVGSPKHKWITPLE